MEGDLITRSLSIVCLRIVDLEEELCKDREFLLP
jgi:hypothetical protein